MRALSDSFVNTPQAGCAYSFDLPFYMSYIPLFTICSSFEMSYASVVRQYTVLCPPSFPPWLCLRPAPFAVQVETEKCQYKLLLSYVTDPLTLSESKLC